MLRGIAGAAHAAGIRRADEINAESEERNAKKKKKNCHVKKVFSGLKD